jgi:hypothetical protein
VGGKMLVDVGGRKFKAEEALDMLGARELV